jgi:hypothetical protein
MLRRLLESTIAVCLAFLLTAEAVGQDAPPPQVSKQTAVAKVPATLPKDTEVRMIVMEPVSSATATKGQRVRLAVAKDVVIDGHTVIPRGTPGTGVVARLQKGVPGNKDGYIVVRPVALTLADGTGVKLKEYPTGEDACGDMGPCWAFYIFVVVIAPLVIAVLPVVAVVALLHRDRANVETKYQREKPAGKDETLAVCSPLTMESYVARPVTLRAVGHSGPELSSEILQCPTTPK